MKTPIGRVCADHTRHTCIEVSRLLGTVKFIPLSILGFEVISMDEKEFDRVYRPMSDYPVEKAAQLYAGYAASLGGTKEAMETLAKFTPLTQKEIEMATATKKAPLAPKAKPPKLADPKPAATVAPIKAKAQAAKPEKQPKVEKAAKQVTEKKQSAADMFRELIAAGKLSDDEIFSKVKEAHNLDDDKRKYVSFYRFDAKRKGLIK